MAQNTTLDGILGQRLTLEQPKNGFRIAVDTVFLAAAVPAKPGEKILDLGCGVGGAMLCVAARVPGLHAIGLEIDTDLAELCKNNIVRNGMSDRLKVLGCDVVQLPQEIHNAFNHVLMNPPYHEETRHDVSQNMQKRTANTEKTGALEAWLTSAAEALKDKGTLTIIHRADRTAEILGLLRPLFGFIEILPLLPKADAEAKRMIFRAYKISGGAQNPTEAYRKNFVLHQMDGSYTEAAQGVLRHMKALEFAS